MALGTMSDPTFRLDVRGWARDQRRGSLKMSWGVGWRDGEKRHTTVIE